MRKQIAFIFFMGLNLPDSSFLDHDNTSFESTPLTAYLQGNNISHFVE